MKLGDKVKYKLDRRDTACIEGLYNPETIITGTVINRTWFNVFVISIKWDDKRLGIDDDFPCELLEVN